MNKTRNKIFVGCLALLLVMVAGYALFSQNLNITGTAKAQGDFVITMDVVDLNVGWYHDSFGMDTKGIVTNPTSTINGNTVNTSVTLGMPGSSKVFGIRAKNTGTIPAKLKSIKNVNTNEFVLDKEGSGNSSYVIGSTNAANRNALIAEIMTDSGWGDDYESDITAGERWPDLLDPAMLDAVLDPGEEAYYFIEYRWADTSIAQGEPLNLSVTYEINFEQIVK